MGTKGIQLFENLGVDVNDLIESLNKALADEWLAYYQYWVGAKVIKGPMKERLQPKLYSMLLMSSGTRT